MEAKSDAFLSDWIFVRKQTATYRLVSRKLGTTADAAKTLLYSFHEQNHSQYAGVLFASYMVSGKPHGTASPLTFKLYNGTSKDQWNADFETIETVQIYALSPVAELSSNLLLDPLVMSPFPYTDANACLWGLIKGPSKTVQAPVRAPVAPPARSTIRTSSPSALASGTSVAPERKTAKQPTFALAPSRYVSRKADPAKPTAPVKPVYSSRKAEPTKPAATVKPTYSSRKAERSERVIVADVEEADTPVEEATSSKRAEQLKSLEAMFDDAEEDDILWDVVETPVTDVPPPVEPTPEPAFAMELFGINSLIDEIESIEPPASTAETPNAAAMESFVDADGYLVTRINPAAKSQKAPVPSARSGPSRKLTPLAKPTATKKRKGQAQSSVMSFFGAK